MKTINGISFENWVCADALLGWGLPFDRVSEILGVDQSTWSTVHQAWRKKIAEDQNKGDPQQLVEKMLTLQENPLAYKFSHIKKQEILDEMEEDNYEDDLEADTLELPKDGLTLDFLKAQDECYWVDLLYESLLNKAGAKFNKEENVLYSIMSWFSCMSAGFFEFYKFYDDLGDKVEDSLKMIGAKQHLKIMQQANAVYKQIDWEAEDSDTDKHFGELCEIDDVFYALDSKVSIKDILLKYAKEHAEKFIS